MFCLGALLPRTARTKLHDWKFVNVADLDEEKKRKKEEQATAAAKDERQNLPMLQEKEDEPRPYTLQTKLRRGIGNILGKLKESYDEISANPEEEETIAEARQRRPPTIMFETANAQQPCDAPIVAETGGVFAALHR
jgi:hypothetical protein